MIATLRARKFSHKQARNATRAIQTTFGPAAYPIHEVGPNVLSAQGSLLTDAFQDPDPRIMELVQLAWDTRLRGETWIMRFTDRMLGSVALAAVLANVSLSVAAGQDPAGEELVTLTLQGYRPLGWAPSLPYNLQRVVTQGVVEAIWQSIDDFDPITTLAPAKATRRAAGQGR